MTPQLQGKHIVVTGAARGIGAAVAAAAHHAGAVVYALDRDKAPAGIHWASYTVDVTDPAAVQAFVDGLPGPVECLVNNAGISRKVPLEALDDEVWRAVHEVNLAAPVRLVRQFLPVLRTPGASIVNVTSIRGSRGFFGDAAYIAAKGGLDAATRALAVELGPAGIRVNAVAPGAVETELNREALSRPDHRERVLARIPLGRTGRPADVAGAVVFLAGEAADWLSGVVLPVDGGQLALG